MAGRGPHHRAEHRHPTGALRLDQQIGGRAATTPAATMAGTLEQHDERDALGQRQLGDPPALRGAARTDGTGERGEVLGPDHDGTTIDGAGAGHDAVSGHIPHQRADLLERTEIEEMLDPLTGIELTLGVSLRQSFGPAHRARGAASLGQIGEGRTPATGEVVGQVVRTFAGQCTRIGHRAPLSIRRGYISC